jgi:DNA (cytosine-5)-methyltransferase 1
MRRDTAPRRETGQGATADAGPGAAFGGGRTSGPVDVAACLVAKGQKLDFEVETFAVCALAVRRLTPRECERLQGFPDDHALVPVRGKPAADGPRYKALGNSMAVNVMEFIGQRIELVRAEMAMVGVRG